MKVILIKNAVETLGYFSEQLAETFQEMGHDTYFVDYDDLVNTVDGISRFAVPEKTVLCTFNFTDFPGKRSLSKRTGVISGKTKVSRASISWWIIHCIIIQNWQSLRCRKCVFFVLTENMWHT